MSNIKEVGPVTNTNTINSTAITRLVLLKILIPLSRPEVAEIKNNTVTMAMMTTWDSVELGIPNK
ncbi:hypothetical protein PIL02S_01825 [Paenibacillus illinoisensis]|uniref:Uncharacterized protein n=1 Tax=Paenibacillus illinoisensis TaxID=59845 RepID=A0A2W0CIL8_9BACL|nr:hypothetical protein PIL02S_01825 [Paenibacillus illinoisensis]